VERIYFGNPLEPISYSSLAFMFIYFPKENRLKILHYCNRSVYTTMNNDQNKYTAPQISRGKQSPWGVLWQEGHLMPYGNIKHYSYRRVLSICYKKSAGVVLEELSQEPQT